MLVVRFAVICHGLTLVRPLFWLWNLGQLCDDEHVGVSGTRGNPRNARDLGNIVFFPD